MFKHFGCLGIKDLLYKYAVLNLLIAVEAADGIVGVGNHGSGLAVAVSGRSHQGRIPPGGG